MLCLDFPEICESLCGSEVRSASTPCLPRKGFCGSGASRQSPRRRKRFFFFNAKGPLALLGLRRQSDRPAGWQGPPDQLRYAHDRRRAPVGGCRCLSWLCEACLRSRMSCEHDDFDVRCVSKSFTQMASCLLVRTEMTWKGVRACE